MAESEYPLVFSLLEFLLVRVSEISRCGHCEVLIIGFLEFFWCGYCDPLGCDRCGGFFEFLFIRFLEFWCGYCGLLGCDCCEGYGEAYALLLRLGRWLVLPVPIS